MKPSAALDLRNRCARQLLAWAARLHEIGMVVSYSGYHKHGAYLVANTDMPGFSRDEQAVLSKLIRTHRRKLAALFRDVPPLNATPAANTDQASG